MEVVLIVFAMTVGWASTTFLLVHELGRCQSRYRNLLNPGSEPPINGEEQPMLRAFMPGELDKKEERQRERNRIAQAAAQFGTHLRFEEE